MLASFLLAVISASAVVTAMPAQQVMEQHQSLLSRYPVPYFPFPHHGHRNPAPAPTGVPQIPEQGWGESWFAAVTRRAGSLPLETELKWYDFTQNSLKQEFVNTKGESGTLLIVKDLAFQYNKYSRFCITVRLPVTIVTPTWMRGEDTVYIGEDVIDGVPVYGWNRMDHLYYTTRTDFRVVRVFAPIDQNGNPTEDTYQFVQFGPINSTVFEIPSFCSLTPINP